MNTIKLEAPVNPLEGASDICRMSAVELARAYRHRTLSPVEVAKAVLDRAEGINPRLAAFTSISHDVAMDAAADSEQRWMAGEPLSEADGVPTTIKDIVWVKGSRISSGSKANKAIVPERDCPAVSRLRAAGCTIIGLTTTPEFGWKAVTDSPLSGITRNPWNDALTPGGSSGGAAVAAAAGAGVFHLGTDGGGSIRIPAAFTGTFGHKPTFGSVAAYPPSPFGTLANIGPMTRDAGSARMMFEVMAGKDLHDWYQVPDASMAPRYDRVRTRGMRVGYWKQPACGDLDPEIGARIDQIVEDLKVEGAIVEEITLPDLDLIGAFHVLWRSSVAQRIKSVSGDHALLDQELVEATDMAAKYSAANFVAAQLVRVQFGQWMDALFETCDLIVSPGTAIAAFEAGHQVPIDSGYASWVEWAGFNFPLNLSQHPACVVPCGFLADGRPIGLQIVGPRGRDNRVLAAAFDFEMTILG